MALTLAVALTFAVAADPYVQDGYNPPEGYESHKVAASEPEPAPVEQTAEPVEQAVYRGMGDGDIEQWRPLVAGHFPPEQVDNALCVINSESGGNPSAKNPRSEARGLFQVMASVWAPHFGFSYAELYEPEKNTYAAARIWGDAGWQPWSPRTRRNCGL